MERAAQTTWFSHSPQVHPQTSVEDLDELSSLLQIPLVAGTGVRMLCNNNGLQYIHTERSQTKARSDMQV